MTTPRRVPPPPSGPPSPSRLADLQDFERLSRSSFDAVQRAAESWRTAALGLLGLGTTGVIISGPDSFGELPQPTRIALSVLFIVGFAAASRGMWQLLNAATGIPRPTTLPALVEAHGSVRNAEIAAAVAAAEHFNRGRLAVVIAIACLIGGLGLWWWSVPDDEQPARVEVVLGEELVCGELLSADEQHLVVQVDGERRPRELSFPTVDNLYLRGSCD